MNRRVRALGDVDMDGEDGPLDREQVEPQEVKILDVEPRIDDDCYAP